MSQRPLDIYAKLFESLPTVKYALGVAIALVTSVVALFFQSNDGGVGIVKWMLALFAVYALALPSYLAFSRSTLLLPARVVILALTGFLIVTLALGLFAYAFGWPQNLAKLFGLKHLSGVNFDSEKFNLIALTFGVVSVALSLVGVLSAFYFASKSDPEIRRLRFQLKSDLGHDFQISVPLDETKLSEEELHSILSKLRTAEHANGNGATT